jgi:membrane associated rhomboid family serine protease
MGSIASARRIVFLIGSYAVIFPRAKMRVIPFLRVPYLRAWVFALSWVALQLWDAIFVGESAGGIAYGTHLGGFAIGLIAGLVWKELALDTDRLIAELSDETTQ